MSRGDIKRGNRNRGNKSRENTNGEIISGKMLAVELRKEKRTGILPLMPAVGILGAAYAFANFLVRGDALLELPLPPMDILLTQLYGMLMVLNMFGIITAACMIYHMEFQGNAIRKLCVLPFSVPGMYLHKMLILTVLFGAAICLQNTALWMIGVRELPQGTFEAEKLLSFAGYSFVTSMPVLAFMVMVSSRWENMWISLGVGVTGFLSGMALAGIENMLVFAHPFVMMLKPAMAMSAQPRSELMIGSLTETILFTGMGWTMAGRLREQ